MFVSARGGRRASDACISNARQILVLKGLPYMPHLSTNTLRADEIMRPTEQAPARTPDRTHTQTSKTFPSAPYAC
eukprot:6192451-Pleurochrysis_carterae.AAC.7